MLHRALTFATLMLVLGGCVTGGPRTATPGAASIVDVAGDDIGKVTAESAERTIPAAWSAPTAGEISLPRADRLMGADRARLTGLLGEPRLRRREAPAEIWLYADQACVLRLFLYQADGGAYRVAYVEASGRRGGAATEACLGRLIDERRAARAS